MRRPRPRPFDDPGKPTPREVIAKARAEAGPRVAKAMEAAAPKVEKAAGQAGKLLGTLRDRAKDTAKQFGEGYRTDDDEDGTTPRRRPKPGPR